MSILIKNATLVTQNKTRDVLRNCDILIVSNLISKIGKEIRERAEHVIDGRGKIALPGLINMHTHVAMSALRGIGGDLPLHQWLEKEIWPAEAKLNGKDIYNGALLGACEMLHSGITCFNEMYGDGVNEIANATVDAGMRATISHATFDLLAGRTLKTEFEEGEKFVRAWKNKNPLVKTAAACHSAYACSEEMLVTSKNFAKKNKLKFHIHVSETRKEVFDIMNARGKYPVEYLDSLGLIDENTILAHASWVTKKEISIIAKRKATIVNCPVSNLKLATGGICPVREYHERGANVCIGTDGAASNNSLNMLESVKMSGLLQRHHYWKADALTAQNMLDFATINGAKALGINSGEIEEGKLADIILLERGANMVPEHDVVANIVYAANPSNVTHSIINGKIVVQNGRIVTVDEKKVIAAQPQFNL